MLNEARFLYNVRALAWSLLNQNRCFWSGLEQDMENLANNQIWVQREIYDGPLWAVGIV